MPCVPLPGRCVYKIFLEQNIFDSDMQHHLTQWSLLVIKLIIRLRILE